MNVNPAFQPDTEGRSVNGGATVTGHKGLDHVEPLIFEIGGTDKSGVDLPVPDERSNRLGDLARTESIGLAGLSEPETVRHYVRLSRKNYSIDAGMYPLGSCTMKHNPRLDEALARLPGFADIHPLQPVKTVQGATALISTLADWLTVLTGMPAVAMSPKAGAHGELCGLMAIRAAHEAAGNPRKRVLVPDSAHGTNPATATLCDYAITSIPSNAEGRVDLDALAENLDQDVAAFMLTNPNTCGLFERDILKIAEMVHAAGAYFYCDGANFNAIVGRACPGDMGIDAMHLNLHKTFSTPHGGGGPGAGPTVFSEALAAYLPVPNVVRDVDGNFILEEHGTDGTASFGRMTAFHGQMGMFVRALAYMMSHGADGLRQVSEDAVLNANYLLAQLKDVMSLPYEGPCMHEVLFDDRFLKNTGVTTLDIAKAMIDQGIHPMTVYFPLVVDGAMLIEPTETESKASLDECVLALSHLTARAKAGGVEDFKAAPHLAPARRMDEIRAARSPRLRWYPPDSEPTAQAAE